MAKRLNKCILISAVTICVGCAYALFCHFTGWGLPCPIHLVTGLNCPGCGVSRMLLSLLRLDFAAAFHCNAVLFCLLPVLLGLFVYWIYRYIRYGERKNGPVAEGLVWVLVILLLLWGVVRNLIGW